MNFRKAQTATEYIIIVAVVIVIALVVVQIMGGFPGIGSGTSKKVSDYKLASTGEIGIDKYYFGNGSVLLTLKNNNFEVLTVNNLSIRGVTCVNTTPSLPRTLNPGQVEIVNCSNSAFLPSMNDDATPSLSATYYNPSTGASYSTNYAGVSSNGSLNSPAPTYNCTGVIPGNATLCTEDNSSLVNNTVISLVASCGTPMCEYVCNPGYVLSSGNCIPPVFISTLSGSYSDNQDLIANITTYSSSSTYTYNWYKNNNLNASSLITNGLVAYWPLNNDTKDYYGSNDGSAKGNAILNSSGKIGGSYQLDGNGDYINTSYVLPTTNYSIVLWYNPRIFQGNYYDRVIGAGDCSGGQHGLEYSLYAGGNIYIVFRENGANKDFTCGSSPSLNTWEQVVITVSSQDGAVCYRNGVLRGNNVNAKTMSNGNLNLNIGVSADLHPSSYFNGSIDEVQIYNRALSLNEVKQIYEGSKLGGSNLSNTLTTVGDSWKVGFKSNSVGGNNWVSEVNSSAVTITS